MNKKFTIFILLVLMSSNILALGVSPGRTSIDFTPELERTISFSIINSENKEINILVSPKGELKDYITVSEDTFIMSAFEKSKQIDYDVILPKELSPGLHKAEIVVLQYQKAEIEGSTIGAVLDVSTQLFVYAPYPGKYAEASLEIIKKDNKINLVVPVINRGEFNLKKVNSNIEIYNHQDELVTTLKTNEISISSKERGELVVELDSSNIASGPYKAIATTLYDGESLTNQKQFTVGLKELVVESIEVNDFTLGKMAEFEILVNNKWSQPITDVYVQMLIYDKDGSLLANLKSPSYNVDSLDKTLITTFWDTKDITKGTYDSEFLLIYEDNSDKKDLTLEVSRNEIKVIGLSFVISEVKPKFFETSNLIRILVILIVVLIIVNIIWFLFVRKKLTRRR